MDYTKKQFHLVWKGLLIVFPVYIVIDLINIVFERNLGIIVPVSLISLLCYSLLLMLLLIVYHKGYKGGCIAQNKSVPKSNNLKQDILKISLAYSGYILLHAVLQLTLFSFIRGSKSDLSDMTFWPMFGVCVYLPEVLRKGQDMAKNSSVERKRHACKQENPA